MPTPRTVTETLTDGGIIQVSLNPPTHIWIYTLKNFYIKTMNITEFQSKMLYL